MPALTFDFLCFLLAFLFFILAAIPVTARVNLLAVGLAFMALAFLLG